MGQTIWQVVVGLAVGGCLALGLVNFAMLHAMWPMLETIDTKVYRLHFHAGSGREPVILTQQQVDDITALAPFMQGRSYTAEEARLCVWNWKTDCGDD